MFKFELGSGVKDVITGFSGVVTSRTEHITGCIQYGVKPTKLKKDGTVLDCEWFDEDRLVKFGKSVKLKKKISGGPAPICPER